MRYKSIIDFIDYARNHRISIEPQKRVRGILLALAGWAFIGISTILFKIPLQPGPTKINFTTQFLSGILIILFGCILYGLFKEKKFNGYKFLKISKENEIGRSKLSVKQRILLIYIRGIIATGGFIIYELAKVSIGIVDNSVVHGADGLMYALMAMLILKQHFKIKEWLGILITLSGILFILYFDVLSGNKTYAIWGYIFGIGSSIALALIIIITSLIVQHDHPIRVAFHQCVCGLAISILIFIFSPEIKISDFDFINIRNAFTGGICYASALICFFYSFLFVEPIIIAISSYSLTIYVIIFDIIINKKMISSLDLISSLLITLGTGILIHEEYKKDKEKFS